MKVLSGHDQAWFWEELAHVIRRGKPLVGALNELAAANAGTRRGLTARHIADSLAGGATLPQAIAANERLFSPGAKHAIEAAQEADSLVEALGSLAEGVAVEGRFRHDIAEAISYPVVVALLALVATAFICMEILPWYHAMWDELDVELPALTAGISTLLQVESFTMLLLPALLLSLLYLLPSGWPGWLDGIRLKVPILGRAMRQLMLARWCAEAGRLVAAGVPEPVAVRLAGKATGNTRVNRSSELLGAKIEQGQLLSEAMREDVFFPGELTWMVAVAERNGGHARVWPVAREMYGNQAKRMAYVGSVMLRIMFALLAVQIVVMTGLSLLLPLAWLTISFVADNPFRRIRRRMLQYLSR